MTQLQIAYLAPKRQQAEYFGVCGFIAVALSTVGYQYGTATMVSWLEYVNIPIGFIYQGLIFGDIPNEYEIIGGILVTIACLIIPFDQLYKYCTNKKRGFQIIEGNVITSCEDQRDGNGIELVDLVDGNQTE